MQIHYAPRHNFLMEISTRSHIIFLDLRKWREAPNSTTHVSEPNGWGYCMQIITLKNKCLALTVTSAMIGSIPRKIFCGKYSVTSILTLQPLLKPEALEPLVILISHEICKYIYPPTHSVMLKTLVI